MNTAKRIWIWGLVVVAACVVIGFVCLRPWGPEADESPVKRQSADKPVVQSRPQKRFSDPKSAVRDVISRRGAPHVRVGGKPSFDEFVDSLPAGDRKLVLAVQDALDNDDFKSVSKVADAVFCSTNPAVREAVVAAWGWFGAQALPELTGAMADPDEGVANAAENAWELALDELENASQRFSIAAAAMAAISDKNHLMTISGLLEGAALEVIDGETDPKKAAEMRVSVVQTLVDIMDSGSANSVQQVKEAYEDITGFEWRGIEEAELYLQDPDNYEMPEDRGEGVTSSSEIRQAEGVAETTDGNVAEGDGHVDSEVDPEQ